MRTKKHRAALAITAAIATMGAAGAARAHQFDTRNPELSISWDNTIRYNLGVRVEDRERAIANSANNDEGDFSFSKGQVTTNRVDLMSELQVDYMRDMGLRVSAAAWGDAAFNSDARSNPVLAARGSYLNNRFSDYTRKYYRAGGELLDAYAYKNFSIGDMRGKLTVGRQTVLWGEAIALSGFSVSHAQAPSDAIKALATPGADARETALPIGQVLTQLDVSSELTLAAQYYFQWRPSRLPEGGTYLAGTDFILQGPDRFSLAPGLFLSNRGVVKAKSTGDWGLSARWRPGWLNGTLGFYARQFDERAPWVSLNVAAGTYSARYAENAKLFGMSLSKSVAGMSIGAELVYRRNTALNSSIANGSPVGARGDSYHLLLNGIQSFGGTPLWDGASLIAEVGFNHLDKIRSGAQFYAPCSARPVAQQDASYGCATRNSSQVFLRFTPQWIGVVPGWDIELPLSLLAGVRGNSSIIGGSNEKVGSFSVGTTATYNTKHFFTLAYNDYLATNKTTNGALTASNGAQIQDRGWISFTYKTAF